MLLLLMLSRSSDRCWRIRITCSTTLSTSIGIIASIAAPLPAIAAAGDKVAHLLPGHAQLVAHLAPRRVALVMVRAVAAVPLEAAHG